MSIKIIDKKKVDVTDDEWAMYKKIVEAYTQVPFQKGEDFFIDLFETDDDGIIIFLKPPSQRQVSLEIFLFCMSIMQHQHIRKMEDQVNAVCKRMEDKMQELNAKLGEINAH